MRNNGTAIDSSKYKGMHSSLVLDEIEATDALVSRQDAHSSTLKSLKSEERKTRSGIGKGKRGTVDTLGNIRHGQFKMEREDEEEHYDYMSSEGGEKGGQHRLMAGN